MTAKRVMNTGVDDSDRRLDRESGIVQIAKREASPVIGAVEPPKDRDDDIEIDTALDEEGASNSHVVATPSPAAAGAASEDDAIEVSDDEIESAEVLPSRPSQPGPASVGGLRSRPPARPVQRSRPPSLGSSLPPPRSSSGGQLPASSRPATSVDPWLLANKTLELSRANARIDELEEHVAFRDARILSLEETLAKTQLKLAELQRNQQPDGRAPETTSRFVAPRESSDVERTIPDPEPAERGHRGSSTDRPWPASVAVGADAPSSEPGARSNRIAPSASPLPSLDGLQDQEETEANEDAFAFSSAPFPRDGEEPTGEDLRQISGIGPRFEAALRKQGITRLSQIAAWSEADVRQVAKALRIPKSRIVKGRWIESAREAIGSRAASE
jgi:predicted flap endonuclease-1-like 5' DNA nuclease